MFEVYLGSSDVCVRGILRSSVISLLGYVCACAVYLGSRVQLHNVNRSKPTRLLRYVPCTNSSVEDVTVYKGDTDECLRV